MMYLVIRRPKVDGLHTCIKIVDEMSRAAAIRKAMKDPSMQNDPPYANGTARKVDYKNPQAIEIVDDLFMYI
jgi:hypothetical protein